MGDYQTFFKNKRVTLMGLGLLGRGAGDAEFLAPLCRELIVTDLKSETELESSIARLRKFPNITLHLGGHREEDFTHADLVIKAAGVPLASPHIAAARKAGVPVYMSTALAASFAREAGASLVGVTGTRGKSTTAAIIYHCLRSAGKSAYLGGNIRGLSTLAMIPQVSKGDVVVLELDSWQLQGFGDLRLSPDIAVFTNLMPDHLNYYGGDMDKYFFDKAQIFLRQRQGDNLIVGESVLTRVRAANPPVLPMVPPPLLSEWILKLEGSHNRENVALAAQTLRILGLSESAIKEGFESFEAVEGRLQFLREVRGVKIYNDNNSTTPDATIAALHSFPGKKIILIAGGSDKGLAVEAFVSELKKCKEVILLPGTGTDRFKGLLPLSTQQRALSDALSAAVEGAEPGDVVLFSPGFASFGLFKNEYDRNDQFVAAVTMLA